MPSKPRDPSNALDDALAAFTDGLLSGDDAGSQEMVAKEQELQELKGVVVRLHQTFESTRPDPAMAVRIRDNLVAEWREVGAAAGPAPFWRRWLQPDRTQRPLYALAMAAALVLVGIVASFLIPSSDVSLPATAGVGKTAIWLFVGLGAVVVGIVWWVVRRRRP